MKDNYRFIEMIQEALAIWDFSEYPQYAYFLNSLLDDEGFPTLEPMDVYSSLMQDDSHPQFVWDFIMELLDYEIEDGNADAMNELGALYYEGKGCKQSFEKAVYYYNMAADNGSRQAQENLGYCYYYGRDVEVDYKKAFHYFALGAFDGHITSLYKIGDMYANGFYVEKNEQEAFHIYEHCLQLMTDEDAPYTAGPVYLRIGKAFVDGIGVERDVEAALVCFQKAEHFLYTMVKNGEVMYKKSLREAVLGQTKARKLMNALLD